jgi:hypothetical protein
VSLVQKRFSQFRRVSVGENGERTEHFGTIEKFQNLDSKKAMIL